MEPIELLERLGKVDAAEPEVLRRTADLLLELALGEEQCGVSTERRRDALRLARGFAADRRQASPATVRLTPIEAPGAALAEEQPPMSPRVRRWRRPFTAAVAAAVIAAVVLPVTLAGGLATHPGNRHPAGGSAIFAQLADVAMAQPATVSPGPGQYQYTASVEANQSCAIAPPAEYCALVPEQRQIWIGANGSGRIRETFGALEFFTPASRAAWQAAGSPPLGGGQTSDATFGPHTLTDGPSGLANAPTNPAALKQAIENRSLEGGPPGPAEDFTQIGDLLRETDASPALRSAAFQVAAELPGVVVLGTAIDHNGRSGVGLAMDSNGVRRELIFDPKTSALMAEQTVAVLDSPDRYTGVTTGTVLGWTVYLASGIVGSLASTPTGTAPPAPPVSFTAVPPSGSVGSPPSRPASGRSTTSALPAISNGAG